MVYTIDVQPYYLFMVVYRLVGYRSRLGHALNRDKSRKNTSAAIIEVSLYILYPLVLYINLYRDDMYIDIAEM